VNYFSAKTTGPEIKVPPRCCSAEPKLVGTMLDSNKGRTIRMFKCECGEQTWTSEAQGLISAAADPGTIAIR
jgi:hypothetical protein